MDPFSLIMTLVGLWIILACLWPFFLIFVSPFVFIYDINKKNDINKSNVVICKKIGAESKIYVIPVCDSNGSQVFLHPIINGNTVGFEIIRASISEIKLITNTPSQSDFYAVNQISSIAKDLKLNIEPQNQDLHTKLAELKRLEKLAASSGMYKQQANLYSRAANQIQDLLNVNQQLIQECYAFMFDIMVGQELAKYNVDDIPDVLAVRMSLDNRCKAVSDRYQLLKSEMDEYMNLKNGN
jgi:hypothetical protein